MSSNNAGNMWSSQRNFVFAAAGAAIGLGNLWRFPFLAGENGGGAFVLVYIGFVILVGVPIMIAELAIGRRGGGSAVLSLKRLISAEDAHPAWQIIGWLSILVPWIGLSYYSVVAGWSFDYMLKAVLNGFHGFDAQGSLRAFDDLMASPVRLLVLHTLFIGSATFVIAKGVHDGIEKVSKFMMPGLLVLLVIMVINAIFTADIRGGLQFLFWPDFTKITPTVIAVALGQMFFSISVGVGVLMTYGSYTPKEYSLLGSAAVVATADTLVSLLAGIAIFSVVFQYGLDPAGGPGLIFVTLPIAFGQMPVGYLFGLLFFVLFYFAAFTTAIGMLEPIVAWLQERGYSRPKMAMLAGFGAWAMGLVTVLSFNVWSDVRLLGMIETFKDKDLFSLVDFVISNVGLPLNAALIALFAGWALTHRSSRDELSVGDGAVYRYWRFSVRYLAPIAIAVVCFTGAS